MDQSPADTRPDKSRPNKYLRATLWILLAVIFIFGAVVENRSVFLHRRMTDADVYFRTAWALRTGIDIYDVEDTNGWHYQYPPFLAVTMVPLANPPPGADRAGMLPYGLSIALWYLFSVACLFLAVDWLASAIEPALNRSLGWKISRGSTHWWGLRLAPVLVCLPSIGRVLSRGQINLMVLMLFCAMAALIAAKRSKLAGVCLGAAISIKLIPGFLLLYGIWRRDWRFLAGCIGGVVLCGLLVPMIAMGPVHAIQSYEKYYTVLLGPVLAGGADQSRTAELLNANGTDSQAFKAVINTALHPLLHREQRPSEVPGWVRIAHWVLVVFFTGTTLWAGRTARPGDVIYNFLFIGCLMVIMVPTSPVSHTHYFVYALPLVMALVAHAWERNQAPRLGMAWLWLFGTNIVLNIVCMPMNVTGSMLKDIGVSLYAALILWAAGIYAMQQRCKVPDVEAL